MLSRIEKILAALVSASDYISGLELQSCSDSVPFYSCDIRMSKNKIAPVDVNLFPAGFNNFSEETVYKYLQDNNFSNHGISNKKILLIVEIFSRNIHYTHSIISLKRILEKYCKEIRIAAITYAQNSPDDLKEYAKMLSEFNEKIEVIECEDSNILKTNSGFVPDMLIVNSDMSRGYPEILQKVKQPIFPAAESGWHSRRKSNFFNHYNTIVEEICKNCGMDPWLISTFHDTHKDIEPQNKVNAAKIVEKTDFLIKKIQKKYDEYQIDEKPYIFVKAENGTHGRGIICISDSLELTDLNKDSRKKLSKIQHGIVVKDVIIQEGISTCLISSNGHSAEYLLYSLLGKTLGIKYRFNDQKDNFNNLNSKGVGFEDITFSMEKPYSDLLNIISRLCKIALCREISDLTNTQ